MLTIACCLVVRLGVRVRVMIRFSVWLVSGCAHVFVLLSVVIITLPAGIGLLRIHYKRHAHPHKNNRKANIKNNNNKAPEKAKKT